MTDARIQHSKNEDINEIFRLYQMASDYQKTKKTVVVWPTFNRNLVESELAENRQWKLVIDGEIACVWAITFSDPQIWEEKNADSVIYIHRIATNQAFRGENFVQIIIDWATDFAKNAGLDFVRLDTLGQNTRLIEYYKKAGFTFLGMFDLKDTSQLPAHYQGVPAALFELRV
jgi:ribosomal protein S18 acetylase RimI-like enzyme